MGIMKRLLLCLGAWSVLVFTDSTDDVSLLQSGAAWRIHKTDYEYHTRAQKKVKWLQQQISVLETQFAASLATTPNFQLWQKLNGLRQELVTEQKTEDFYRRGVERCDSTKQYQDRLEVKALKKCAQIQCTDEASKQSCPWSCSSLCNR